MGFDNRWLAKTLTQILTNSPLILMFISWVFLTIPHLFIRYCNNPTEITRNYFCGVFLKNHKYLWEMFLRRLRDVTEKKSFSRHARDVLKTSHKRHLFFLRCIWNVLKTSQKIHLIWDVSKRSLRCLSQWRSDWDLSETSHDGWDNSFSENKKNLCHLIKWGTPKIYISTRFR